MSNYKNNTINILIYIFIISVLLLCLFYYFLNFEEEKEIIKLEKKYNSFFNEILNNNIFVINIEKDIDRFKNFRYNLSNNNIRINRFNAINGNLEDTKKFMSNLKHVPVAESLGGVETLLENPALMTHSGLSKRERNLIGITDNLIRLSVGIEYWEDICIDLKQALDKI